MPVTREARYLSGVDLGKTVVGTDVYGDAFQTKIRLIEHGPGNVQVWGPKRKSGANLRPRFILDPADIVTITGKPS